MNPVLVHDRWVYRRDGNDYGPLSTDELLAAIADHKVDLQTQVCALATGRWQAAAEHALLRDYYDKCVARWQREAFHSEADAQVKKLARRRHTHGRVSTLVVIGLLVAAAVGGWLVWKLSRAEPLGIDSLVRVPRLGVLPVVHLSTRPPPSYPTPEVTEVRRLSEPETYDTAGVGFAGDGSSQGAITRLDFSVDGQVRTINRAALDRVVEAAKRGLHRCARAAAKRDRRFAGTDVGFTVEPGKITHITVGGEVRNRPAFRACVKSALGAVAVPRYEGGPRHVTVPLKISW